jgi:Fe-S-cluster formation regulator IscX/YfhJ
MTDYAILLDGERVARIDSDSAVRAWIAKYREDHVDDDPAAAHLQILERGALAWLTGGKLVDRERFL